MRNLMISIGLVSLSFVSAPADAEKLYKWVDKDGNTHFSQTPPPKEEPAAAVEQVKLRSTHTMKPHKEGRNLYCGTDRLNTFNDRPAIRISNLEQYVVDRKREIGRLQDRRLRTVESSARYRQSVVHQSEELRRIDNEIDTEQCKLDWAAGELAALSDDRKKIDERAQTIKNGITDLEQEKVNRCGIDNRTGIIRVDDDYRAYQKCIEPFNREIKKLQRELSNAERDQQLVNE